MIYRDGDASSQKGLTVWAETAIAPKSNVNTMPYFVPRTTAETVIEANYQIILKRWLSITPDLQYIMQTERKQRNRRRVGIGRSSCD